MKPSTYIIGILVFTFFIVGGVSMMSILRTSDPTYANDPKFEQFNDTFNVYSETSEKVSALGTGITSSDTDWGLLGVLNGLIMAAWQSLKLLLLNFSFMNTVFNGLYTIFGVPAWISGLVILGVTVMFVFSLYSAFFQRDL
uniref:Uncharacterized protein n=1 Tax=viral metagenome TaxID=1070528 RepID=A0A6M3LIX9_9ZZZZ